MGAQSLEVTSSCGDSGEWVEALHSAGHQLGVCPRFGTSQQDILPLQPPRPPSPEVLGPQARNHTRGRPGLQGRGLRSLLRDFSGGKMGRCPGSQLDSWPCCRACLTAGPRFPLRDKEGTKEATWAGSQEEPCRARLWPGSLPRAPSGIPATQAPSWTPNPSRAPCWRGLPRDPRVLLRGHPVPAGRVAVDLGPVPGPGAPTLAA